jgi:hypothetical protein
MRRAPDGTVGNCGHPGVCADGFPDQGRHFLAGGSKRDHAEKIGQVGPPAPILRSLEDHDVFAHGRPCASREILGAPCRNRT